VTQDVLHHSQVLGNLQRPGGEGVAQGVRHDRLLDAGQLGVIVPGLSSVEGSVLRSSALLALRTWLLGANMIQ